MMMPNELHRLRGIDYEIKLIAAIKAYVDFHAVPAPATRKPRWTGLSLKHLGRAEYNRRWRLKSGRTKRSRGLGGF